MAKSFFKSLIANDRSYSRTLLHENIPITGALLSGTYNTDSAGRGVNIKTFSHGMFQQVYDYPAASSSANKILDLTAGFSTSTGSVSSSATSQVSKKVNIYTQMAQILNGYDTGSSTIGRRIKPFDADGVEQEGSTKHHDAIFINFSRLLVKDEIKKGSFSLVLGSGPTYLDPFQTTTTITDSESSKSYKAGSPAGEFGLLKSTAQAASATLTFNTNQASVTDDSHFAITDSDGTTSSFIFKDDVNTVDGSTNPGGRFIIGVQAENANLNSSDASTRQTAANAVAAKIKTVIDTVSALDVVVAVTNNVLTITQGTTGTAGNSGQTGNFTETGDTAGKLTIVNFTGGVDVGSIGLIYYQAGIAVLSGSVFSPSVNMTADGTKIEGLLTGATIDAISDATRHRIKNVSFNNTTELNSTIFFCRANHNEFNYSSNPTYLSGSEIVIKNNDSRNEPFSFVTTVGLYSPDNELMAVAKLSEPLKKSPSTELNLRVRLDY
jgi:hypothetical protein